MPDITIPGVYIEQMPSHNRPIQRLTSHIAGFIGGAERGPLEPRLVTSWAEFIRLYGRYVPDQSFLAYAVEGFFTNGGRSCYVARVASSTSRYAMTTLPTADGTGKLHVIAFGPGTWGERLQLKVSSANTQANGVNIEITLTAAPGRKQPQAEIVEHFKHLRHDGDVGQNIAQTINSTSNLIRVWWENDQPKALAIPPQANEMVTLLIRDEEEGNDLSTADFDGTLDPIVAAGVTHPAGLLGARSGLAALAEIDDIALLVAPDDVHPALAIGAELRQKLLDQCERLGDRFTITAIPAGQSDVDNLPELPESRHGALYYPWIRVFDPVSDKSRTLPASGHIAGIYARSEIERGTHKAPANEVVRGALELEFPVSSDMQETLNPQGINCIRQFSGRGIRVWGARTLSGDLEWRFVPVRRIYLELNKSLDRGLDWVVFEPNDEPLWVTVVQSASAFLRQAWTEGALMGVSTDEAYFVTCDRTTMTAADINAGRLKVVIGLALIKPAEFTIFQIEKQTLRETT